MALLFWDSFDHYATGDTLEKWSFTANSGFMSYAIGAYGRNSTNGVRINGFGARWLVLRRNLSSTPDTIIMGCSFEYMDRLPNAYTTIFSALDNGTKQVSLRVLNNGALQVLRNTTAIATSSPGVFQYPDTQYFIEMKCLIDNAAGTAEVYINGVQVINASGLDTQQTANAYVDQVEIGGVQSGYDYDQRYDDFYVCDDSGGYCNDFLSDSGIYLLMPEGVGAHADWTPLVGANWQEVDDNPPDDDTTYNSSATATDRDSFEMEDLPGGIAGTVHAVGIVINCRKDDAGVRTIEPAVRSGGADYDGAGVNVADTYAFHIMEPWETDPDTAAPWLVASVNAMEAGYELAA